MKTMKGWEDIAIMRCRDRPVKYIAKTLGMKREEVERIIAEVIRVTDPHISRLLEGRVVDKERTEVAGILEMSDLSVDYAKYILSNETVLDYMALKWRDHHDRYMDCIRFRLYLLLREGSDLA